MARTHRFGRLALIFVAAALLAATACKSAVEDPWHLSAKKGTAAVGEKVKLGSAQKTTARGCAGFANDDVIVIAPDGLDWAVTPPTGRVEGGFFVADEPGTYKLAPAVKADSISGLPAGSPLGPTLTIQVTGQPAPATKTSSTETTGGEVQASMDTSEAPAKAGPLAGTWTYSGMLVRGAGPGAKWERAPKPGTLVIEDRAGGYYLEISGGTSQASLDGDKVTLERNFPSLGVSVRYEGVLSGDTIRGTQHNVANKSSHDDPWVATRQK